MKRLSSALFLSACLALLLAGAASAQQRTIKVYNWSDYIDESVLSDFTKATGVKVVYDVYDSNDILRPSCSPVTSATTSSFRAATSWRGRSRRASSVRSTDRSCRTGRTSIRRE